LGKRRRRGIRFLLAYKKRELSLITFHPGTTAHK